MDNRRHKVVLVATGENPVYHAENWIDIEMNEFKEHVRCLGGMVLEIDLCNMWNSVNLPAPWSDWADVALQMLDETDMKSPDFRNPAYDVDVRRALVESQSSRGCLTFCVNYVASMVLHSLAVIDHRASTSWVILTCGTGRFRACATAGIVGAEFARHFYTLDVRLWCLAWTKQPDGTLYPYDLDAPLEEPPAMDPNIGGELINKSPQWAFEADHRVQEKDNTKFRLPPEPVKRELWQKFSALAWCLTELDVDDDAWVAILGLANNGDKGKELAHELIPDMQREIHLFPRWENPSKHIRALCDGKNLFLEQQRGHRPAASSDRGFDRRPHMSDRGVDRRPHMSDRGFDSRFDRRPQMSDRGVDRRPQMSDRGFVRRPAQSASDRGPGDNEYLQQSSLYARASQARN